MEDEAEGELVDGGHGEAETKDEEREGRVSWSVLGGFLRILGTLKQAGCDVASSISN